MRLIAVVAVACLIGCGEQSECRGAVAHICRSYDEGTSIRCIDEDCAATGRFCVEAELETVFCALESEPSCSTQFKCEGSLNVTCYFGYAVSTRECAPAFCGENLQECVVRDGVDPGCHAIAEYYDYPLKYCDGDVLVTCNGDYAVELLTCDSDQHCYQPLSPTLAGLCASAMSDSRCTMPEELNTYQICTPSAQGGFTGLRCIGAYFISEKQCTDFNCSSCP